MATTEMIPLKSLNLPERIYECYEKANVEYLFKWQAETLTNENVLRNGRNFIYSAPTSAGKSLIAEILILKTILESERKALYILPFISVAREKMTSLQAIFRNADVRVEGYIGTTNATGGLNSWDLGVCTIEKSNSLVNHLMESGDLDKIGIVVVDELHTVGDPQRGYLLELLLTKLTFFSKRFGSRLQIIGMSATLPNIDVVARWLDAELYSTNFRPVPLTEFIYCEKKFYDDQMKVVKRLTDELTLFGDSDNIVGLILETVSNGQGVLVFCSTKAWCEQLSNTVAKTIENLIRTKGPFHEILTTLTDKNRLKDYFIEYKRSVCCVDPTLAKTLPFIVAFHHAGLTMEEREHIERGFRLGFVKVIVATSTLSSGVNLPAKRVIIRSPWGYPTKPGPFLSISVYKQMVGRAGRLGIDTSGESILMCKASELKRGQNLIQNPLDSVHSSLMQFDKQNNKEYFRLTASMKRAILEIIVGGMAFNVDDVIDYVHCTFAFAELSKDDINSEPFDVRPAVESCIEYLLKNEFIQTKSDRNKMLFAVFIFCTVAEIASAIDEKTFTPTQLGSATLTSSLPPDEALAVFADLQNACRNFVLDTDLHLLYLVTPYNSSRDVSWVDWTLFYEFYTGFSKNFRRVADVVGVKESFLASAARRGASKMEKATDQNEIRQICVHKRFFIALALSEVINETSLGKVAQTYGCDRGQLQSLQQQASTYAGMMVQFCDRLGWYHLKVLLSGFAERIAFGVRRELTELVQIDGIDGSRARAFHCSGFSTVASLVQCDVNEIVNVLRKAVPFQSANDSNKKHPWLAGNSDLTETEAATLILERAKKIYDEKLKRFGVVIEEKIVKLIEIRKNCPSTSENSTIEKLETVKVSDVAAKHAECVLFTDVDVVEKPTVFDGSNEKSTLDTKTVENLLGNVPFDVVESKRVSNSSFRLENDILNDSWFNLSSEEKKRNTSNGFDRITITDGLNNVVDNEQLEFDVRADPSIENLIGNLSRFSISPMVREKSRGGIVTESQILDFLNDEDSSLLTPELESEEKHSTPNLSFNDPQPTSKINQSSTPTLFADSEELEPKMNSVQKILSEINSDCLSQDLFTMKRSHRSNDYSIGTPVMRIKRSKNKENIFHYDRQLEPNRSMDIVDLCQNDETFENCSINLKTADIIAIEIDGTKRKDSEEYENVSSVVFCADERVSNVLKLDETNFGVVARPDRLQMLRTIVARSNLIIVVEESKEFLRICQELFHIPILKSTLFCIRTAAWMLNQDFVRLNLLSLAKTFLPVLCQKNISSHSNARICFLLYPKLLDALKMKNLDQIFYSLETKIVPPTLKMETIGVIFDVARCDALIGELENLMKTIERRCFTLVGRQFSINSHREVSKILYVDLGLPPPSTHVSNGAKTKLYSTTRESLKKLSSFHILPGLIVDWRRLHHTLSCYLYSFRKFAKVDKRTPSVAKIFGRYERFTTTGRMIMREPSLQTFPKRFEVNADVENSSSPVAVVVNLRSLILPSRGYIFLAADYSQMELRLLAHFSNDTKLKEILNSDDGDVFKMIAAAWTKLSVDDVTSEQRQRAKQICYGIIYGIGPASLAVELNVGEDDAVHFMDSFKAQYKEVSKWIANTVDSCRKNGFVTTISGRRRYLESIRCGTSSERGQAQRQSVNTTIQGSAADIFKSAFIRIDDDLRRSFAAGGDDYGPIAKIVLQMHDELIVEVRQDFLPKIISIMKKNMETNNEFKLSVKLPVNFKIGDNWGELVDYKL